jgi:hypothetical protein
LMVRIATDTIIKRPYPQKLRLRLMIKKVKVKQNYN